MAEDGTSLATGELEGKSLTVIHRVTSERDCHKVLIEVCHV